MYGKFRLLRPPVPWPRIRRWYSVETLELNPSLRSNLFSEKSLPPKVQDVPLDTYPNPLYSFSKEDLMKLDKSDLNHLLSIPYKSVTETDKFCFNVLEIVHENIIKDPSLAAKYINAIKDPETRTTIVGCLMHYYKTDRLRRSLIMFIDNPTSAETRREILETLEKILCNFDNLPEEAAQMGLSYLKKLALTGKTNQYIMFAPKQAAEVLMKYLPQLQRAQLYACLLNINMKFQNAGEFEKLKKSLLSGSNIDKLVARTGIIDAKWQDTNKFDFDDAQKARMVHFLTFNDLALFTEHAINEKDVVNANLYLDLLVTKFESPGQFASHSKKLQTILNTMLHHSMVFKGPQECLKFLKYMKDSELEIRPATLLRILSRLREDSFWDEALFLINYLHTETLDPAQRKILTREIMMVITRKFDRHPQVAIGYFASIFTRDGHELLQLLKDLQILDLVYGPDQTLLNAIKRAEIHEDLKGAAVTHEALKEIYLVVLKSLLPERRSNVHLIKLLFSQYMEKIECAIKDNDTQSIFHPTIVQDDIVCLFLDHLLRVDTYSKDNMDLNSDRAKFDAAKHIYTEFFARANLKKNQRKVYTLDLMITSSLLYHRDITFAAQLLKNARECGMPLSFNQLYPFIMYHYSNGEHEQARQWYNLLTQNGVKAKNVSADRLIEVAKELNWPVKGTMYRTSGYQKNKRARIELARLTTDPLLAFAEPPATEVLSHTGDLNLLEELGGILHAVSVERK